MMRYKLKSKIIGFFSYIFRFGIKRYNDKNFIKGGKTNYKRKGVMFKSSKFFSYSSVRNDGTIKNRCGTRSSIKNLFVKRKKSVKRKNNNIFRKILGIIFLISVFFGIPSIISIYFSEKILGISVFNFFLFLYILYIHIHNRNRINYSCRKIHGAEHIVYYLGDLKKYFLNLDQRISLEETKKYKNIFGIINIGCGSVLHNILLSFSIIFIFAPHRIYPMLVAYTSILLLVIISLISDMGFRKLCMFLRLLIPGQLFLVSVPDDNALEITINAYNTLIDKLESESDV